MKEQESALRQVSMEKAFYFFSEVGKYTGKSAASLKEFSQRINEVDEKSVRFHLERGDFENWIAEVLKDKELAEQVKKLHGTDLSGPELRNRLHATILNRIDVLTHLRNVQRVREQISDARIAKHSGAHFQETEHL